uniref:complement component receptor 1-like protein isoform X2 n=1 Tax=Styela clava TaxID=7725 RepID=UPI00193A329D|nr:complement component receptor 1-like protein isoform X2 [Styela clava]
MGSSVGMIVLLISCFSCTVFGFFPNDRRNKMVTCEEPNMKNGNHNPKVGFFENWRQPLFELITFTCNDGFELKGAKRSRCQLNGKWYPEEPTCEPIEGVGAKILPCVLPPVGDHVDVNPLKATYDTDETVDFACNGFRKSDGFKRTRCGKDGEFHPSPPKCIQPKCPPPQVPSNGAIRPNRTSYSVGEVVNFKCIKGYKLVGKTLNATCGEDGHFTASDAKCKVIYCKRPEDPEDGKVESDQPYFRLGQKVKFSCNNLHYMYGADESICSEDGLFYPQNPTCHRSFIGYYGN